MKIVIVGAGHAGVEAAHFANKLGVETHLVTFSMDDISHLPCNVSIGGSAKGIVVKELDALGGIMPVVADETQLQTKILNRSKGPAVQALRVQVDKILYPETMKNKIIDSGVNVIEAEVESLIIEDDKAKGVILSNGERIVADAIIIATGTFLKAKTMKGQEILKEGPDGKQSSISLSDQLAEIGLDIVRLKTGTPPRIEKDTINFSVLEEEPGTDEPTYFTKGFKKNKEFQNIPA